MQKPTPLKYSLSLLNRRWYSFKMLQEKLLSKYDEKDAEKTLQFLVEKDFINDIRFAKLFIKDHQNLRHEGKFLINQKLIQKGISKDDISIAWQQYQSQYESDEIAILIDAIKSKFPSYSRLDENVKNRRLISYLSRKGYTYDLIKRALAELKKEGYN